MRILVASDQHHLLPFAWRLRREGADVEVLVFKDRFERAWEGMFEKALVGKAKGRANLEILAQLAADGEMAILTDSERGMRAFSSGTIFGSYGATEGDRGQLSLGGWFNGSAWVPSLDHIFVNDWGLWPGGFGPEVLAGGTLVRGTTVLHAHLAEWVGGLAERNFRGLVGAQVVLGEGEWKVGQIHLGWPRLHSDAFFSVLSSLTDLFEAGVAELESQYVVVVPVTMPPWPVEAKGVRSREVQVGGLTAENQASMFFRDFYMGENYEVRTAGLDGYVCVVRGDADTLELARNRAVRLASQVQLPERQVRFDVGARAGLLLGTLHEASFWDGSVSLGPSDAPPLDEPLHEEIVEGPVEFTLPASDGEGSSGEVTSGHPVPVVA